MQLYDDERLFKLSCMETGSAPAPPRALPASIRCHALGLSSSRLLDHYLRSLAERCCRASSCAVFSPSSSRHPLRAAPKAFEPCLKKNDAAILKSSWKMMKICVLLTCPYCYVRPVCKNVSTAVHLGTQTKVTESEFGT